MKRRSAHILILVAILLATLAGAAVAQDEITLEGVSARLEALISHVATVIERVEAIEAKLAPPITADGDCILYVSSSPLQRETVTKYIATFEEDPGSLITLKSVYYNGETGLTTMQFSEGFSRRQATETWDGCEFAGSTDWTE